MRKRWSFVVIAAVTATAGLTALAGESKAIKIGEAPAAVQAAVRKAVGGGTLGDVKREAEDGKTVFEADFKLDNVAHSVKVSESGDVLEEEHQVDVASLPTAVTAAVKAKYAEGKIEDAEMVKAGGQSYYELDVDVGKEDHEVRIDASGKVIADKVEDDEKDEKDEKDGKEHGEHK